MKGVPTEELVLEQLPRSAAAQTFHAFLEYHVIPEVRMEVHSFYGHLDDHEARYPGLDYTNATHRMRLSRWPWHRKLFRAFDYLRLTDAEIASITKWEGTKWAKERFEQEQGHKVKDTASDGMRHWAAGEERAWALDPAGNLMRRPMDNGADGEDIKDEHVPLLSVGEVINENLRTAVQRREVGEDVANEVIPMDELWDQWYKGMMELGEREYGSQYVNIIMRDLRHLDGRMERMFPAQMIRDALAGRWRLIPEHIQGMLRVLVDNGTLRSDSQGANPVI